MRLSNLSRRAGAFAAAAQSYERALSLVTNDSERRFLERRSSLQVDVLG